MTIYLPIAEIPLDIFLLLIIGGIGGLLAGIFGIGGGFLITPILIFLGVPASVAVATSANQIIASSITGFLAQWYRKNVDIKMGLYLLLGGLIGAFIGIQIFKWLEVIGQIDLVISLIYVFFLGSIGSLMFYESSMHLVYGRGENSQEKEKVRKLSLGKLLGFEYLRNLFNSFKLPFRTEFPVSNLKISILLPVIVGTVAGIMVSLMGIGGGFIMIPAMIYILKMPTTKVVGTSLFQIIFTTSIVTILHALNTKAVDIVLALFLIIGGVIGAQIGSRVGMKLPAEKLRFFLAIIILAVCSKLAFGLFVQPEQLFNMELR